MNGDGEVRPGGGDPLAYGPLARELAQGTLICVGSGVWASGQTAWYFLCTPP